MLRLDKVIKPWKESASLNDHINLYGFWNETAFLAKCRVRLNPRNGEGKRTIERACSPRGYVEEPRS